MSTETEPKLRSSLFARLTGSKASAQLPLETDEEGEREPTMAQESQPFEGQLTIDMHETTDALVVKSTIAGVQPEDLDITVTGDQLTIRGERRDDDPETRARTFAQECYWGFFSRTVTLPIPVDPDAIEAELRDGVLIVTLAKSPATRTKLIRVKRQA
ncbi:MAG: Hsp20/alpha crystallin family protein [Parcubacteria group bacterium]|nr:Hsp20/alpha crystallin family protein [Parcubacteria group bacterium]